MLMAEQCISYLVTKGPVLLAVIYITMNIPYVVGSVTYAITASHLLLAAFNVKGKIILDNTGYVLLYAFTAYVHACLILLSLTRDHHSFFQIFSIQSYGIAVMHASILLNSNCCRIWSTFS